MEMALGEMPARVNLNLFHLDYEDMQRAAADEIVRASEQYLGLARDRVAGAAGNVAARQPA